MSRLAARAAVIDLRPVDASAPLRPWVCPSCSLRMTSSELSDHTRAACAAEHARHLTLLFTPMAVLS